MTTLAPDAGPLLGQAATLLDNASRDVMRAGLRLDAAGLDIAPEFGDMIEHLSMMAAEATAFADTYAEVAAARSPEPTISPSSRSRRHG